MIRIIGMSFGIILLFPLHLFAQVPGCEKCGCCKDGVCGWGFVDGRNISQYCTRGCIPGYGGNKCYIKCPTNCLTRDHNKPKLCESCIDGKYLSTTYTSYKRDCLNCSPKCKKCTSLTTCQECMPPYLNDDITIDCSLTCPRNCLCESVGICFSCRQGYYNTTNQCRDICPSTCFTCTDKSNCQSCRPPYSGDSCCIQDGYCKKCSSNIACERCVHGYYGEICNKSCPATCQTVCEREIGACLSCNVGLYGDYCTMNCSERCLNRQCQKITGYCTDGCVAGFEGTSCAEKVCVDKESDTENEKGKVIGIATAVFISILLIMIVLNGIAVRKWKEKYQRMIQALENPVSYVNTPLPSVSIIEGDDQSLGKEQYEYETLDDRNVTHGDEYEQIQSMN